MGSTCQKCGFGDTETGQCVNPDCELFCGYEEAFNHADRWLNHYRQLNEKVQSALDKDSHCGGTRMTIVGTIKSLKRKIAELEKREKDYEANIFKFANDLIATREGVKRVIGMKLKLVKKEGQNE